MENSPNTDSCGADKTLVGRAKSMLTMEAAKKTIIIELESPRVPRRGWAEMIKKVYEVNPLACPKCQGEMRIIAFLTDYAVVDRIIHHLKLTFVAERSPRLRSFIRSS